jgi:hypothetical protein
VAPAPGPRTGRSPARPAPAASRPAGAGSAVISPAASGPPWRAAPGKAPLALPTVAWADLNRSFHCARQATGPVNPRQEAGLPGATGPAQRPGSPRSCCSTGRSTWPRPARERAPGTGYMRASIRADYAATRSRRVGPAKEATITLATHCNLRCAMLDKRYPPICVALRSPAMLDGATPN